MNQTMTRTCHSNRGGALVVSLVALAVAATLAYSAVSLSTSHRADLQRASMQLQSSALADAGIHRAMQFINNSMKRNPWRPYRGVDAVFLDENGNSLGDVQLAENELVSRNGRSYGTFSVIVQSEIVNGGRNFIISSTGYVPDADTPLSYSTSQAVVRAELESARSLKYSYFVNHWGWFYGDSLQNYGNVHSNGQFDADGYAPLISGTPRYEHSEGTNLIGYRDDNADGVTDGSDGGIYSGWDITGVDGVLGMGGLGENQHDFQDRITTANLSDLSIYEETALASGSSIQTGLTDGSGNVIGTAPLTNAVLGDESGEPQNLVLVGTAEEPIVLDGLVVVRGDVIIKGTVTGQGTIYAGRNVYIADDVHYLNGPATELPASESEADTEAWIQANETADYLGLFAAEHIVMGNFLDPDWQSTVGWWLNQDMNASDEDQGLDQLPDTLDGRDGTPGTEDDDLLEGDGQWTVETYTDEDASLGLIPDGYAVGDVIPGTGEDIDGDGVWDDTTTLSDFAFNNALDDSNWLGLPDDFVSYEDMANGAMTHVDGSLYTNHVLAMVTFATGVDFTFFGGLSSRIESIIYATDSMRMVHDRRLAADVFGDLLPEVKAPLRILAWKSDLKGNIDLLVPEF